jgi:hypothetical protein
VLDERDPYKIISLFADDKGVNEPAEKMSIDEASAEDQRRSETLHRTRAYFEGKEAIYIEKGALRVRISNIRYSDTKSERDLIEAEIEEIPTPGLPVSLPGYDRRDRPRPLRWKIGKNIKHSPHFAPQYWAGGPYAGWSMYFSPKLIQGVIELASEFPQDQSGIHSYRLIHKCIRHFIRIRNAPVQILTSWKTK